MFDKVDFLASYLVLIHAEGTHIFANPMYHCLYLKAQLSQKYYVLATINPSNRNGNQRLSLLSGGKRGQQLGVMTLLIAW